MLKHTNGNCMFDKKAVSAIEILEHAKIVDHRIENGTRRIDLVSDELAPLLPFACEVGTGGGCTTHYEELIPVMIGAIQELSKKVNELAEAKTAIAVPTPKKPSKKAKEKQDVQA